jgi:hypothetical protein
MNFFKLLLLAFVLLSSQQLLAQTKPAPVKFKPPKLFTQMGGFRDSVTLSVAEAENIINQPLKIFDDKKGLYTISSYQFLYRRKVVTEDEATGKPIPTSSMVAGTFKVTPMPQIWVNSVKEQVRPGEELYFFDIIAKDAQGRVMYAPDFKIKVVN